MITISTFAAMIVPIAAPTWMYAARGLSRRVRPQASAVPRTKSSDARMSGLAPSGERHSASYTSQLATSVAMPTATPAAGEIRAVPGSTRNDAAPT